MISQLKIALNFFVFSRTWKSDIPGIPSSFLGSKGKNLGCRAAARADLFVKTSERNEHVRHGVVPRYSIIVIA
jgi:hypothetical protein